MIPDAALGQVDLEARLRFEMLLADLSSRFINLAAGDVDREIEDAQRRVCECLALDMSSLWQSSPLDPLRATLSHIYRRQEGPPLPQPMDGEEYFPWSWSESGNRSSKWPGSPWLVEEHQPDQQNPANPGLPKQVCRVMSSNRQLTFGQSVSAICGPVECVGNPPVPAPQHV